MIRFSHIYKTYPGPTYALKDISLSIDKGEFVFLTGSSGAGKTTLFRLISAFDRPSSGHVHVAGYDLDRLREREIPLFRRRIGVVYQDFRLHRSSTAFENVALPLEVRGDRKSYIHSRAQEMLEKVGLGHKKDFLPGQLSGGEQQRVAIARALIHHPGVLVADEPTGNLDPQLSEEIMDLLEQVNAQGTTVFVATHDRELVKRRKKRVVNIEDGCVTSSV